MNKVLLLTLVLGATALAGVMYANQSKSGAEFLKNITEDYQQYQAFLAKYKRTYGPDETHFRFVTFQSNLALIKAHNANYPATESYFLGVNQFADMTVAEFKQKMLGYKADLKTQSSVEETVEVTAAPASVDWTTKGAVTPVKNQGQCGSCWAFSSTGSLEGLNYIKTGKLQSFSEQQLVDCSTSQGNQGCNGGLMDYAFTYVKANGITTEANYPYKGVDGTCKKVTSAFKNTGYKDVTANSESALLAAIAQGPVSVAIEADTSAFQLYSGGILNNTACGTQLDHGVLAVGYGSNFYKVKNSWAASWGEQGYVRLARTGNGAGMCGIQMQPSYPTA